MEPLRCTTEHGALVDQRRRSLRDLFSRILPASAEFVWEIGCGHGHFLVAYAAAHRSQHCIGIDVSRERIERAERKRERAQLPNAHFVQADDIDFLAALPPDARFSAIYILFPDPWPKRRHHKNRILTPAFLEKVAGRAGEGARLFFRTDFAPYFAQARSAIAQSRGWRLLDGPWPFEATTVFQEKAAAFHSFAIERTEASS